MALEDFTITHVNNLDEVDQLTIWRAVDLLCKDNPHAAVQLKKLAELKESNPLTWKMGLKFLKLPG